MSDVVSAVLIDLSARVFVNLLWHVETFQNFVESISQDLNKFMSVIQNDLVNILIAAACVSIILYTVPRIKWASIVGYLVVIGYVCFWTFFIIFAGKHIFSNSSDFPWRASFIVMIVFTVTLLPIYLFVKSSDNIFDKLAFALRKIENRFKETKK